MPSKPYSQRLDLAVAAGLVMLTASVFSSAGGLGFVHFDDPGYLTDNPVVRQGLSWASFRHAFTHIEMSNWHPLTLLSLMLDVRLWGMSPGWMHLVNVVLHSANTVLLFVWLRVATGSTWRSALVAALFAVHPLHVESVAWISERKDVLSTFFWLSTLVAYGRWVARQSVSRYLLVFTFLAMGLLSKPMVVTLPFALLLLDYWPLGRIEPGSLTVARVWPLVREKFPLFALALGVSLATLSAQAGAKTSEKVLGLGSRIANATTSAATYLWKTIAPIDLAVFYPHEGLMSGGPSPVKVAASAALLAAISCLAAWQWRRRPYLAVGWLWYLGTLVPVIGIVQVGLQGMADRYTYVPLIGVFVMVAWSIPSLETLSPSARAFTAGAVSVAVVAFSVLARAQISTWKDTESLFGHAVRVNPSNWLAWKNLGAEQYRRGRVDEALHSFERAIREKPWDPDLWLNLAKIQSEKGHRAEAAFSLERAVQLDPRDEEAWYSLAIAYAWLDRPDQVVGVIRRLKEFDSRLGARLSDRIQRERTSDSSPDAGVKHD